MTATAQLSCRQAAASADAAIVFSSFSSFSLIDLLHYFIL